MNDKPVLINSRGQRLDIEEVVEHCRKDPNRILANDEVGMVIYVGDLDVFTVTGLGHPKTGEASPHPDGRWVQKVKEFSVVRFGNNVRRQIGSVIRTLPADSVFHIRDGSGIRKVKACDLKPGMVLRTGEKVYW
jgi:hypothetical protein